MSRKPRETYDLAEVELLLTYAFHGGQAWGREDAPAADMPKAKANPARQNTHAAAMVDTRRAWHACIEKGLLRSSDAVWLRLARGLTYAEVAKQLGLGKSTVHEAVTADIMTVRDAMNQGLRPAA